MAFEVSKRPKVERMIKGSWLTFPLVVELNLLGRTKRQSRAQTIEQKSKTL